MPAIAERCTSQYGKRDVPAYPASILLRKEAEALNWARVGKRVTICPPSALPGWGTADNSAAA